MASPAPPQSCCSQQFIEIVDEPSIVENKPGFAENDFNFIEPPSQDFFCPVSLELLLEPQLTSCCGHHLSLDAATRLQRERKPCPMCNDEGWNAMLDKYHRRKVHEVRVRCWHLNDGCEWAGQVNGLKRHAESCEKRPWECRYCALKCTYIEGEKNHWPTCPKFPEPCPNACEVGSVERCNMEQHLSVCPLEPVACEMKEFGCHVVVPRKELATHMRESELQHLTAMTRLNLSMTRQLQQASNERDLRITQLQQEITELKVGAKRVMEEHEQTLIDSMQKEITKLEGRVQKLQQISEHIEQHTALQCTGCSVFTFSEYSKRKASNVSSHSVLFHSHQNGYTFQLVIVYYGPDYNDIGAKLRLMKGDYDNQLYWPVNINVCLELLNQADDHHHVVRYKTIQWNKDERDYFDKIIDEYLMEYRDLERKGDGVQYMMNDSLKFRVCITVV